MKDKSSGSSTMTLPSDREIVMERVFNAPRELVFKAHTDPELIPKWWGPRKYVTTVDKLDLKVGGVWRFVQRDADGNEYAFNGVYREIVPPERLSYTFEFEGMPGHVLVETLTFEERDGKTRLTVTSLYQSVEDRDGMLQSGMEEGAIESHERLAELLEVLNYTPHQSPTPNLDLKSLDRLVGTWEVSGDAQGQIRYEWEEGGFFLMQHFDLVHDGRVIKGIEVIGHLQGLDEEPGQEIRTRVYSFLDGLTLDYVYELAGDTLTIWGGEKGSPAYYRGMFNADGNILTGGWVWPGGGYNTTTTRVK